MAGVVQRQQHVDMRARQAAALLPQVARQRIEHEHVAVGRQVEQLARVVALEQQAFEDGHRVDRRGPGRLHQRDRLGIVLQRAAGHRAGVPVGRVGVEAAVEAGARALVGAAVALAAIDLEQLGVGQRALAAGAAQVRHQQVDRGVFLAQRDEEVGLLLEVEQFLDRQLARRRRILRHRRPPSTARSSGCVADRSRSGVTPRASLSSGCGASTNDSAPADAAAARRAGRRAPARPPAPRRRPARARAPAGGFGAQLRFVEPGAVRVARLLAQLPQQRADGGERERQQARQPGQPVAARLRLRKLRLQLRGLFALDLAVALDGLDALFERAQLAGVGVVDVGQHHRGARGGGRRRNDRLLHVELEVHVAAVEHEARRFGRRGAATRGPGLRALPASARRRCRGAARRAPTARSARWRAPSSGPCARHASRAGRAAPAPWRAARCSVDAGATAAPRAAGAAPGRGIGIGGRGRLRQLDRRGGEIRRVGEYREATRESLLATRAQRDLDDRLGDRRGRRDSHQPFGIRSTRVDLGSNGIGQQLGLAVINIDGYAIGAESLAGFDVDGYRDRERLTEYCIGNHAAETERTGLL